VSVARLAERLFRDATVVGTDSYNAITTAQKGPEVGLAGCWYDDEDGNTRTKGPVEWWNSQANMLSDVIRVAPSWSIYDEKSQRADELPEIPLTDLAVSVPSYPTDGHGSRTYNHIEDELTASDGPVLVDSHWLPDIGPTAVPHLRVSVTVSDPSGIRHDAARTAARKCASRSRR
jgi:hypothetical protein